MVRHLGGGLWWCLVSCRVASILRGFDTHTHTHTREAESRLKLPQAATSTDETKNLFSFPAALDPRPFRQAYP